MMNKMILYLTLILISCNNNKNSNNSLVITPVETIQRTLKSLSYVYSSVSYNEGQLVIQADTSFSDDQGGNVMLLNYLEHQLYINAKQVDSIGITINYKKVKHYAFYTRNDFEDLGKSYWIFAEKALEKIRLYDCVYYDLTVEMVKPETHYSFDGDLWRLILKLSEGDEEAKTSFIAFYNWSINPYDDDLSIDRKKFDWFVKEIGINPKSIDNAFVDSIYQQKGYKGFFK